MALEALRGILSDDKVRAAVLHPEILVGTFSYLLMKPVLKRSGLVDTRKGAYRRSMVVYNLLMAVFSAGCFFTTATALGWDRGYGEWLRQLSGDSAYVQLFTQEQCPSPVWRSRLFVGSVYAFYYSKYVEYLDTAWMVLKGKEVIFLQSFHHFGAPWDVYLGIALQNEGVWIFMILNSFIHTIMYTYYGLTALGITYPGKCMITISQITQFLGGFYLVWEYIDIPCFRASPSLVFSWLFNYAYVGIVLTLFLRFFYFDNFVKKKRMKSSQPKSKEL
uniref:Elongation of fatty acids protein n=1 Tax=Calcidiscus leptoporus TaxID=127549 RepID=A0A7S0IZ45_9EUKA|mmetsp:Transcript_29535/g.69002  ORF Transcript_29535/g.69002 Transcript_29535/m.69002 type:complete len:276 (+) Transcript_29535:3-830(+)